MKQRFLSFFKGAAYTTATLIALTLAMPERAKAILGFGDIVFDPSSYATLGHIWSQDVSNYTKLLETVTQLERIYASGLQMYNLSLAMSQSFNGAHKGEWITLAQMAVADYTQDKYGENRNWSSAVSGNPSQVPNAWQMATVALNNGTYLAGQTPGHSAELARLASMEALDGSSTKCLSTISQYRGNSLVNQLGPILKLEIARADGTAETNSEIQQLNILAAEHEQGNTESRAQGAINACLAEQQILANKIQRDAIANDLNFATAADQYFASEGPMWGNDASESISTYRSQ